MGPIGPTGFIFRDFIKYILPTAIACFLFVPLTVGSVEKSKIELLILISFLMGYVIYNPVARLSGKLHKRIKLKHIEIDSIMQKFQVLNLKYDLSKLWNLLEKEEREYLYLTQSYIEFYQITAFYVVIYLSVNILKLLFVIVKKNLVYAVICTNTNLLFYSEIPTISVILISSSIAFFLYNNTVIELNVLYGDNRQYQFFAEKLHKEHGCIAKTVWGEIENYDKMEHKEEICLGLYKVSKEKDECLKCVGIDTEGKFLFVDQKNLKDSIDYGDIIYCKCYITQVGTQYNIIKKKYFFLTDRDIPNIQLELR